MEMQEMKNHKLVDRTLIREGNEIVARCTCGWRSGHFSSMSASVAFQQHQEEMARKGDPVNDEDVA